MPAGYAGDLTPRQAWDLLVAEPEAVLVDVRTRAEWTYVGMPELTGTGRQLATVEWHRFGGVPNPGFLAELDALDLPKHAPLAFLCRSGVRSAAAARAATAAGYTRAYNVLDGFEGRPDAAGRRGTTGGWKVAGLPWRQS